MNLNRFFDIEKVVVHPGSAHRDDFISIALILGSVPGSCIQIERRDPTEEDLKNPSVLVVDQGREHNPDLNNYDHHHFSQDKEPACSITLILMALECYEEALIAWHWLKPTEFQDVRGPNLLAKELNLPGGGDVLLSINSSPVEGHMLNVFQKQRIIEPGDFLFDFFEEMGQSLIKGLSSIMERLEDLKKNVAIYEICGLKVIDNSYISKDNHPGRGMGIYRKKFHPDAQVSISSDKRGDGISMTRTNDDGIIDFRKIQGKPGVRFAHGSGFMCALDANIDPKPLIELSIVSKK